MKLRVDRVTFTRWVLMLSIGIAAGCGINQPSAVNRDGAPLYQVKAEEISDAVPRRDVITRAGNKNPYTVLGKTYRLLPTSKNYKEAGIASWYGTKFHGRPTANGEPYSLYGMTAAHKTLPIPTYVKVTNLTNNRTAVVRVNDRGPFHDDRIIDLSYAAAVKLGYADNGTARVLVEAIDTSEPTLSSTDSKITDSKITAPKIKETYFLQVGAFKSVELANRLKDDLVAGTQQAVNIEASVPAGFYRVKLGPLASLKEVERISEQLLAFNITQPRLISK